MPSSLTELLVTLGLVAFLFATAAAVCSSTRQTVQPPQIGAVHRLQREFNDL